MIIHKETDTPQMRLHWAKQTLAETERRLEQNPENKILLTDRKRSLEEIAYIQKEVEDV